MQALMFDFSLDLGKVDNSYTLSEFIRMPLKV